MNCRTFHKYLEDYLEERMDFADRFAQERHARQCAHCGRELASARILSRMAHDLERVKAPANFETSVLNEIATRKIHRRFSLFRRVMVFGFDFAYWRKYALAVSGCIVLGLGLVYWNGLESDRTPQESVPSANHSVGSPNMERSSGDDEYTAMNPIGPAGTLLTRTNTRIAQFREGFSVRFQTDESDYSDYSAIGPDDRPMIVPLPNIIQLQIGLPSEEYYIKNVSH